MNLQSRDIISGIVLRAISCLIFLVLATGVEVFAQEDDSAPEKYRTRISLSCTQKSGATIDLQAKLLAKTKVRYVAIKGTAVDFYVMTDSSEIMLGNANTNDKGFAVLEVAKPGDLPQDTSGYITIIAKFEGNDTLKTFEADFSFKRAFITLDANEEDSVKTMRITALSIDESPVEEAEVILYVPRLFSLLKVAEGETDEEGVAEVVFPDDLPGNKANGELTVIARIADHDDYSTIETKLTTNWGNPFSEEHEEGIRALWSIHTPIWMLVTFIVLITVVWGHFFIIIFNLYQIKKESLIKPGQS